MAPPREQPRTEKPARISGHGLGGVDVVLSVDAVEREALQLGREGPDIARLDALAQGAPLLALDGLRAGYGKMEIVHGLDLRVGKGQSLCLIGPNGAGKSTVLHAIYGFATVLGGTVTVGGKDITALDPNRKLKDAGIAYVLQDNSVFPDMTVEENLWMGGFLMPDPSGAKQAAARIFDRYPRLAERRHRRARVLSGGERRLLEISRALIMDPQVLLIDEPSIGLEPRYIDMVFEIMNELQHRDGKTIVVVEQNAKKGLEFADLGYVLVAGQLAIAGPGRDLLADAAVGRLFLGG
jgi:branched-chain amino acid transport system ATP-binding protein